jgi:ribonuclease HI
MLKLTTYTDGGARGNPGPAAIGVVISGAEGGLLKSWGEYIGETTNNQAEYKALLKALSLAAEMGASHLNCYLDSELVVKQLQGKYKIREEGLKLLASEALKLMKNFESVEFIHVPREKNKLADRLVNEALDKQMGI